MNALRLLGAALFAVACGGGIAAEPDAAPRGEPPTVLFVCEHGTVKSLLAKLLFEREAAAAGLAVRAESRGVHPDDAVPRWMRDALRTEGFDIAGWRPQSVSPADLASADYVVTFDVELPAADDAEGQSLEWNDTPSVSRDYATGRDAIRARVRELVSRLRN